VQSASLVVRLGPFAVDTDSAEVAAFGAALGDTNPGRGVPLTFPIRWLASPEIQSELRRVASDGGVLLVHESQSFSYVARLESDRVYRLDLILRRESTGQERAVLQALVSDGAGSAVAEIETVLRLVPQIGRSPE
jgi:hypothetical protein